MSQSQGIPFLDLVTPHVELEQELTAVFQKALRSAGFIGGAMVEDFERAFASFCQAEYAVAVNSGTDALRYALIASLGAAGIGIALFLYAAYLLPRDIELVQEVVAQPAHA